MGPCSDWAKVGVEALLYCPQCLATAGEDFELVDFGPVDFGPVDFGLVDFEPVDFGLVDFGLVDFEPVDFGPWISGHRAQKDGRKTVVNSGVDFAVDFF